MGPGSKPVAAKFNERERVRARARDREKERERYMHTHIWVCVLSRLEVQAKETGRTSRNSPMPGPRPGLCPDKLTLNEAIGASDGGVETKRCGSRRLWPCCPLGSASH